MTNPEEYLQMSGIQHFSFCRRQWALAYLEQQWAENLLTAEGRLEHTRCHEEGSEKRGELLTVRGMRVISDVYAPFKYPDYNASNYRGEYSYREKWW